MDEFLTSHQVMLATLSTRRAARVYQRFLGLAMQAAHTQGMPALGLGAAAMLDELAVLWTTYEQLPVLFALNRMHQTPHSPLDLSLNALGRLLHRLRQDGWVVLESSDKDGRTKLVRPTEQTHQYFRLLGQCMALAIQREHTRLP
ncbi:MAG: hypothetical protein ACKOWD_13310 [Rhodoferax sp.]